MRAMQQARSFSLDKFLDYFIPKELRVQPDWHRRARMFMLSHVFGPFLGNVIPLYLYLVGHEIDYRFWIFVASITAFWAYPFILKKTQAYHVVAFVSVQNLLFCIFWAIYSYGGIYSPFLPWILITPILAFFYLPSTGRIRDALLLLIVVNVTAFAVLVLAQFPFPSVDLEMFQVIGIISTISASTYVAMMSLYFARVLSDQQRFEREVGEFVSTSESLQSITAAAKQASAAKADFVASMSHELRTPLNAVIGYSQLLLDNALDDGEEAFARDVENIHGAGTHLLKLVNDILDFSKIDAGKYEINASTAVLSEQLADIGRIARPALAEKNYTLHIDLTDAQSVAHTDWVALTKGLVHLIEGAAGAEEGGSLRLVGEALPAGGCRVQLIDPHGARDGRTAENLFDIFTDDGDASPTKYGGAGIALALGARFVQVVGGTIQVFQGQAGERIFNIFLPAKNNRIPDLALAS